MKTVLKLVHDKDVIGLGRTIKAAETAVEDIETFHTDPQTPNIVLWRQKALRGKRDTATEDDGVLAWCNRVFF